MIKEIFDLILNENKIIIAGLSRGAIMSTILHTKINWIKGLILKSGAFEFIQKPFDSQRLINFVNRAVENHSLKKLLVKHYMQLTIVQKSLETINECSSS